MLALWWLVLGPATAMTFYEPAYVAIQQAFAAEARPQAIAALTLTAGLSGPVFIPATGALVEALGWRDATRVLAAALACAAPVALLFVRTTPRARGDPRPARWSAGPCPFRRPRLPLFTPGAVLGYGAIEAVVVHRVARFQELGFGLGTVTLWAGVSGLVDAPRAVPAPRRGPPLRATALLAGVLLVLALSTALMVDRRAATGRWRSRSCCSGSSSAPRCRSARS